MVLERCFRNGYKNYPVIPIPGLFFAFEGVKLMLPKMRYPRPQLQRSDWICLNGPWKFTFDDDSVDSDIPIGPIPLKFRSLRKLQRAVSTTRVFTQTAGTSGNLTWMVGVRVGCYSSGLWTIAPVWVNSQFIAIRVGIPRSPLTLHRY